LAQIQQSQIATQLGAIVQQQNDFKVEGNAQRIAKKVKSVQKYLGDIRHNTLLRISRVATETGLAPTRSNGPTPTRKSISLFYKVLSINQAIMDEHDTHLQFVTTSSHLAAIKKMAWGLTSRDAIETGLLSPFLYGDTEYCGRRTIK